ncbi:sulfite oxidase [Phreatobacter sp.]|uniref:sulfite oxidase n=1 Tax=Phreatobacter sp. TaxID=1966341 RepID=UPI0022BC7A7D|nr:sulfite oxidase [Phreatobacter sp.]MCZ8313765.1 sulfite oxidase [Phreatobacter sp.]
MPHPAPDAVFASKPRLRWLEDDALNGEPDAAALDPELTPDEAFFVRNNGDMPAIGAPEAWRLEVTGEVRQPLSLSLTDLARDFPVVDLSAVLECAGNGRAFLSPPVSGAQWRDGAVGCARWTGVRMRDVLQRAGLTEAAVYTAHHSPDRSLTAPGKPALSRGIPIAKALAPETLLAFAMNGAPLPALHGGPLRVVVPGYPGSAWQKWLDRLEIRDREHDGEKMRGTDYRLPVTPLGPGEAVDPAGFAVITDMPVKSLITTPAAGFTHGSKAPLAVAGWAWSGATPVAGVRVSADGGASWTEANLAPTGEPFAWRRFSAALTVTRGPVTLVAVARDLAGREQPLDTAPWNPRGYCNNLAHRVAGVAA